MFIRIFLTLTVWVLPTIAMSQASTGPSTGAPNGFSVTTGGGNTGRPTGRRIPGNDGDKPHEPIPPRGTPPREEVVPPRIRVYAAPQRAERPPMRHMLHTIPVQAYILDVVLVRIEASLSETQIQEIATEYNLVFLERFSSDLLGIDIVKFRLPDPKDMKDVLRRLQTETRIRTAQPEYVYLPAATGEPALQYATEQLRLPDIHRISTGAQIKIAVIDTAIDTSHPEFTAAHVSTFSAFDDTSAPLAAHGSGIVGILVASDALTGIAPDAHILSAQAFRNDANGNITGGTLSILRSIEWAYAQQAPIYNLSFAGYRDPLLEDALSALAATGAIPVAAAGNDGTEAPPAYPAAYDSVIAVTASTADASAYEQANVGKYIDLTAPGVDLLIPANNQGYALASGTSLAAAYVSGAIAVLMAHYPDKTPEEITQILLDTAIDLGERGPDFSFGHGQISPLDGLNYLN